MKVKTSNASANHQTYGSKEELHQQMVSDPNLKEGVVKLEDGREFPARRSEDPTRIEPWERGRFSGPPDYVQKTPKNEMVVIAFPQFIPRNVAFS